MTDALAHALASIPRPLGLSLVVQLISGGPADIWYTAKNTTEARQLLDYYDQLPISSKVKPPQSED